MFELDATKSEGELLCLFLEVGKVAIVGDDNYFKILLGLLIQ